MKNQYLKFSAASLLLTSLSVMAQTSADQKIITKYCATTGTFIPAADGRSTLQCAQENVRYFFEKTNGRLGIENTTSLTSKPYEKNPELWKLTTLDYLLEFARSKDSSCEKIELVENLPVLKCKPNDRVLTETVYINFETAVKKMYNEGAANFATDPEKTEIGKYLIARDTTITAVTEMANPSGAPAPYTIYQNYFSQARDKSPFPEFKPIEMPLFYSKTPYRSWQTALAEKLRSKKTEEFLNLQKVNKYDVNFKHHEKRIPVPASAASMANASAPAPTPATITATAKKVVEEVVIATAEVAAVPGPAEQQVKENEKIEIKDDKSCQDQLTAALSKILADDKKNIIGQQYELTVMKMAALALGENSKSLEGLIKSKSEKLNQIDDGVIDEMNKVYKAHGLNEDAQAITNHLKLKAAKANYYPVDKRFFNQDSSAFVLAYQKMNPTSGIKDTDVSVLWFMDKVTKKAQSGVDGKYSSLANRTNLSTRIAQYTGLVGNNQALSAKQLAPLIDQQKKELDGELTAFIADFKLENATCFNELFGKADCELTVVEASLSQLLAVNSKISSTDMITLDKELKGGIDQTRFKIAKFAN